MKVKMFPISSHRKVSVDALYGFLACLPADAHIVGIREDWSSLTVGVFVESAFFPECPEGHITERVPLRIICEPTEYGVVETAEWRWTE